MSPGSNKDKRSHQEKQYAADTVNYRLGPARLYQFRENCGDYPVGWGNRLPNISDLEHKTLEDSPLKQAWIQAPKSKTYVPDDWRYFTLQLPREFGDCGYEAEVGHTEASGRFMIQYLKSNNWLDENSTVLFFEQTFINIPVNTFVMLRVSFQFAHGGRVLAKIRVNQETFFISTAKLICNRPRKLRFFIGSLNGSEVY